MTEWQDISTVGDGRDKRIKELERRVAQLEARLDMLCSSGCVPAWAIGYDAPPPEQDT